MLMGKGIDAYVADHQFRKRDPRFKDVDRYKERHRRERAALFGKSVLFLPKNFTLSADQRFCICPAGKRLYRNGGNVVIHGYRAVKFRGRKTDCRVCELRSQCLKHPDRTEARQAHFFLGRSESAPETFSQKMKRKIDSLTGRMIYGQRIGTAEPVFANIRFNKGLDYFTLRGKRKVNTQWLLFCVVHNLGKIHQLGLATA
jgi:hypothetical protein